MSQWAIIFDFQSKRNRCKFRKLLTFNRYVEQHFYINASCDFLPCDSSYPEHLANSVSHTDTTLRVWLSTTYTTLCARLSKSRLLSPIQHLPIYIFSLFTQGLLGYLLWSKSVIGHFISLLTRESHYYCQISNQFEKKMVCCYMYSVFPGYLVQCNNLRMLQIGFCSIILCICSFS